MESLFEVIKYSVNGGFWRFIGIWAILLILCRVIITVAYLVYATIVSKK